MAKTRGHSSHYGPIPPYSGYPGYSYPSSSSHHQPSSYLAAQQHSGYHRPPPEETSPPPVYEYLSSTSRPGKDNYRQFRLVAKSVYMNHILLLLRTEFLQSMTAAGAQFLFRILFLHAMLEIVGPFLSKTVVHNGKQQHDYNL